MNTTISCYDVVFFVMIFTVEQETRTGKIAYVFHESAFFLCHASRRIITTTSQLTPLRLKSPTSPLFALAFVQAYIKENINSTRHWPLRGESTGDRWIPLTRGQ